MRIRNNMTNRYLEKIAAGFIRPLENLVGRTKSLKTGILNRERKINMGLSNRPAPAGAVKKLEVLDNQSKNKMWRT
jgi:hypothetical protein